MRTIPVGTSRGRDGGGEGRKQHHVEEEFVGAEPSEKHRQPEEVRLQADEQDAPVIASMVVVPSQRIPAR